MSEKFIDFLAHKDKDGFTRFNYFLIVLGVSATFYGLYQGMILFGKFALYLYEIL